MSAIPQEHPSGWTELLDLLGASGLSADVESRMQAAYISFNVKRYGAFGDGSSHQLGQSFTSLLAAQVFFPFATSLNQEMDWAASQAMVNEACSTTGVSHGDIYWSGGTYIFGTDSVVIPANLVGGNENIQIIRFLGYNAKIKVSGNTPAFDRPVSLWTAAGSGANGASTGASYFRPVFEGLRIWGTNPGTTQYGIRYTGSQNMVIRNCEFKFLDGGSDLTFCIGATVENNLSQGCTTFAHRCRDAVTTLAAEGWSWTGSPTIAGFSPNWITYRKNRDVCSTGQFTSFWIESSYNTRIEQCISEGNNPQRNVYFKNNGNGRFFTIDGLHVENSCTVSLIEANAFNKIFIQNLHLGANSNNKCIIDASGSNSLSEIHVEKIAFWPTGAFFRHGTVSAFNNYWYIENVGSVDFLAAAQWDTTGGNFQPNFVYNRRPAASGEDGSGYPAIAGKRLTISTTEELRLISTSGNKLGRPTSTPVRDFRFGAAVPSPPADSVTTVFTIPHGITDSTGAAAAPTAARVEARNLASSAQHWVSVDATNITITFAAAPTAALTFYWEAWR